MQHILIQKLKKYWWEYLYENGVDTLGETIDDRTIIESLFHITLSVATYYAG